MSPLRPRILALLAAPLFASCEERPASSGVGSAEAATRLDEATLDTLEAIGYAGGTEDGVEESGVVLHDPLRASPGPVLYVSGHAPVAYLIDTDGEELHRWQLDPTSIWPGEVGERVRASANYFRRAYPWPDGGLLVIFEGFGLVLLDRGSRVVWERLNLAHHAAQVLPDGTIYVLTRRSLLEPAVDPVQRLMIDFVTELGPDGETRRAVSVLDALLASEWSEIATDPHPDLPPRGMETFRQRDLHHTNALWVLQHDHPREPALRRGQVLLSSAHLCAVFALDLQEERVTWLRRGDFLVQHEPTMLDDGNVLLFDNHTRERGSRVIEIDAGSGAVVWQYPPPRALGGSGPPERFFSYCCGTCYRLPGGNTFITITGPGRVIEVTRSGETVWEFRNPHRTGPRGELVGAVFDARKIAPPEAAAWLGAPSAGR